MLSFKSMIFIAILSIVILLGSCAFGAFLQTKSLFNWLFGEPTITVNTTTLLRGVQSMSHLTTTRYTYSVIITSQRDMPPLLAGLYGDRLALVAVGHVTAGIDLSQLTANNIQSVGNTFTVRLPAPVLQDCFFNEQESYVASRDTGLFARPLANLDDASRHSALRKFRDDALQDGILEEARIQAEIAVQEFISLLPGVESVNIIVSQIDQNTLLPDTCR